MSWRVNVFWFFRFLVFPFCACGGEPLPDEPATACEKHEVITARKAPVLIKIFIDEDKYLEDGFVLDALNSIWREVGVTVVQVPTMAEADAGLIYAAGNCAKAVELGRIKMSGWDKLDSIIIDYDCFDRSGYRGRFPAAASHGLGLLLGIEPYPDFCSAGVMSESVGRMQGPLPTRLSLGDKEAFYRRSDFVNGWDRDWKCYEPPKWERGEYKPVDYRTVKFWAEPALAAVPIAEYLNRYFQVFGRSFELANEQNAEFVVKTWEKKYKDCSPLAITYNFYREIQLKSERGCLQLTPGSERDATIVAHEAAHLFGVSHVPEWCGNAIMDPQVNPGPYFTPADVKAWQTRDFSWAVLE